jgi:hypothetical protein
MKNPYNSAKITAATEEIREMIMNGGGSPDPGTVA